MGLTPVGGKRGKKKKHAKEREEKKLPKTSRQKRGGRGGIKRERMAYGIGFGEGNTVCAAERRTTYNYQQAQGGRGGEKSTSFLSKGGTGPTKDRGKGTKEEGQAWGAS